MNPNVNADDEAVRNEEQYPPCREWCTTTDCYAKCGQTASPAHNSYGDHRCALHRTA